MFIECCSVVFILSSAFFIFTRPLLCLYDVVYQKNDGSDIDLVDPLGVGVAAVDTSIRRFTSSPPTNDSFQFVLENATETQSHTSNTDSDWLDSATCAALVYFLFCFMS